MAITLLAERKEFGLKIKFIKILIYEV